MGFVCIRDAKSCLSVFSIRYSLRNRLPDLNFSPMVSLCFAALFSEVTVGLSILVAMAFAGFSFKVAELSIFDE